MLSSLPGSNPGLPAIVPHHKIKVPTPAGTHHLGIPQFEPRLHPGPWSSSYTFGMKTAISVPDDVFASAERLARELRVSRSALYRDALAEYLLRHQPDELTATMDRALEQVGEGSDSFVREASRRLLEAIEW